MCETDRGLCELSIWRLTLCYGTRKIVKNILAFFVKYRYYVSKVNIQGNIDENNEDRRKEAMTGDSRGFFF